MKKSHAYCAGFFFTCVRVSHVYFSTALLQPQQYFPIFPQFFQVIKSALIGGEEMYDHIAIIHNDPAIAGEALLLSLFLMFGADVFDGSLGERVNHAVTGAGADDEIVGKRDNFFQVYQDDVFPLFIFKGVCDFMCKF